CPEDALDDLPALGRIGHEPRARRQVGPDALFQVEDELRVRREVGVPVPAARRPAQIEAPVDVVEPRLDPARLPALPPGGGDVDRSVSRERVLDGGVHAAKPSLRPVDADAVEIRVLGCLIEKQRTTPDVYPLSLNALRLACNQSTNRDPVVEYDEPTIRGALERLARRRYVRLASGHTTRATKYRHLLDDTLSLDGPELSVLAVLMLRGAQTPGELRQRSERLHRFADHDELQVVLDRLA